MGIPETTYYVAMLLYLLAAVTTPLVKDPRKGKWIVFPLSAIASLMIAALSLQVLLYGKTIVIDTGFGIPVFRVAVLKFTIDTLSALFALVISIVGFFASVYSISYMEEYFREGRGLSLFGLAYPLFIASMILVVTVSNMLWFLVFWELMAITGYAVIVYRSEEDRARFAGLLYFVVSSATAVLMYVASAILVGVLGDYSFGAIAAAFRSVRSTNPEVALIVTLLFLIGFMAKAGVFPLHFWLPYAHAECPSNISALLSGVTIKVAVYALVRFVYMMYGPDLLVGLLIATFGVASIVVGNLWAVRESDIKRLLAFSSIGHMGYIWLGIGAGIALHAMGQVVLAALAMLGGLLHVVNHAMFKSTLFLTAGAVIYRAGTRNIDRLGGLARYMPYTTFAALVGSLSVGVPLFSGFNSKWLIYVSTLSAGSVSPLIMYYGIIAFWMAAASLAYAIKYFSGCFTGREKSHIHEKREVPASMTFAMVSGAVISLFLGLFPIVPSIAIEKAIGVIGLVPRTPLLFAPALYTMYSPLMLAIYVGALTLVLFLTVAKLEREVPVWASGERFVPSIMEYRVSALYRPLEEVFAIVKVGDRVYSAIVSAVRKLRPLKEVYIDEAIAVPITKLSEKFVSARARYTELYFHVASVLAYLALVTLAVILLVYISIVAGLM